MDLERIYVALSYRKDRDGSEHVVFNGVFRSKKIAESIESASDDKNIVSAYLGVPFNLPVFEVVPPRKGRESGKEPKSQDRVKKIKVENLKEGHSFLIRDLGTVFTVEESKILDDTVKVRGRVRGEVTICSIPLGEVVSLKVDGDPGRRNSRV